ncbi:MAG: oligosaccharide flippase family protein [Candidatus Levybacteria bacterium]|nr:oligosaccharide flippase family protein [Candidatus Levybacteria bacterium]
MKISKTNQNKKYYLDKNSLKFLMKYGTTLQKIRKIIRLPKTAFEERKIIANRIRTGPFIFNFLSLNISSVINRLLTFVLFFFLIRYFSVEDYGIYTLVWAHIGILAPILDLGTTNYSLVYISSDKTKKYNSLLSLRLILSFIVFLSTIILGILLYNKPDIILYIVLTSFVIFSNTWSGSYLILTSIKEKNYLAAITSSIFIFLLVVLLILSLVFTKNLLFVFIFVFALYNLYSVFNIVLIKNEIKNIKFAFDYAYWLYIIKKSYIFVLITFFAGIYFKFDVVLIKLLQSEHDVGIYSAGYKFFEALIFIASSYTFTATPILAKLVNKNIEKFFLRVKRDILLLGTVGILTSAAVYLLTPIFLPLILKSNFLPSLLVLRIVIFALPFIFISTIFMNALYVLKKTYIVLLLFVFQTIFNLTLNYIFIPQYSYLASAYITVVGEVLNVLILVLIFMKIKKY